MTTMYRLAAAFAVTALVAGAAEAQVYRLSPEQIQQAQLEAANRSVADDALFLAPRNDGRIHGEVGAFVGTGGSRGIFGTVVTPLGENGSAAFSFEQSQYNGRGYGNYPYGYTLSPRKPVR